MSADRASSWARLVCGREIRHVVALGALAAAGVALWIGLQPESPVARLWVAPSLWIMHLLVSLPLASWLARRLARRERELSPAQGWLLATSVLLMSGLLLWPWLGRQWDQASDGIAARALVRSACALGFWLPLALAGLRSPPTFRPAAGWGLIALGAAVGLPWVQAHHRADVLHAEAETLLAAQRWQAAYPLLCQLSALGDGRSLLDETPAELTPRLASAIDQLTAQIDARQARVTRPDEQIELARALAMLDRWSEARRLVEPLAAKQLEAALLLAALLQYERQFEASDHWYRAALARLAAEAPPEQQTPLATRAFDALAFNARARHDPAAAEAIYRQALVQWPEAEAHFRLHLGRHLQATGQAGAALGELERTIALGGESEAAQAAVLIDQLRRESPWCVLRPGAVSAARAAR